MQSFSLTPPSPLCLDVSGVRRHYHTIQRNAFQKAEPTFVKVTIFFGPWYAICPLISENNLGHRCQIEIF